MIELPGQIIEDSVATTRSTPSKEAPNFLQTDGECLFEGPKLLEIDGKAFERKKVYRVAIYQFLLGEEDFERKKERKRKVKGEVKKLRMRSLMRFYIRKMKKATHTLLKGLRGGMNEIEPLMSYVKEKVTVPSLECCLPAKDLVMEFAMRSIWRRICGGSEAELRKAFAQLDEDKNGQLSKEEVQKKLKRSGRSRKSTKSHTFLFLFLFYK